MLLLHHHIIFVFFVSPYFDLSNNLQRSQKVLLVKRCEALSIILILYYQILSFVTDDCPTLSARIFQLFQWSTPSKYRQRHPDKVSSCMAMNLIPLAPFKFLYIMGIRQCNPPPLKQCFMLDPAFKQFSWQMFLNYRCITTTAQAQPCCYLCFLSAFF